MSTQRLSAGGFAVLGFVLMAAALSVPAGRVIAQAVATPAQKPTAPTENPSAQVDRLFQSMDTTVSPGCAVAAMKDGKILYERGYGMADLDHNVPITPTTVFHIASMSKQFTAAAIVILAQEGKLSLDDPVRKYVPEVPDFGVPITIRQLVHHTSGLRDQWDLLGLAGWRMSLDLVTDDDVLGLVARQKELNFPPGSQELYSNTGYTLLAQVVKRVSGQSFREFTTARIFQPLGMKQTHFRDDHAEIVKNIAYGYGPSKTGFRLSIPNFDTVGATSLLTTVEDLALWDENFYHPRVGGPAMIAQMLERGTLGNGEQTGYAFGLMIGTYRGLLTVEHGGSDAGYQSTILRFPDQHFTAVCLCNLSTAADGRLTHNVAEVYLAHDMMPAAPIVPAVRPDDPLPVGDAKTVQLSEAQLSSKVGLYVHPDDDGTIIVALKAGKLIVQSPGVNDETRALGENHFRRVYPPAIDFQFETSTVGGPLRLVVTAAGGKPMTFDAVVGAWWTPSAEELTEYAGVYRSEEIDSFYELKVEQTKLMLHRPKNNPSTLAPYARDLFDAHIGLVQFKRDGKGAVIGFTVSNGRVINLRFDKR
jgi:CubicO group peptidase (beta-lactamase class C family)